MYVSYIHILIYLSFAGRYIRNSQYDQLPVGLIAQLIEHSTGITEFMGSIFFQAFFSHLFKLRTNCEDLSSI